jgi:hypothetical protein
MKQRKVPSHNPRFQKLGPMFIHGVKYIPTVVKVDASSSTGEPRTITVTGNDGSLDPSVGYAVVYLPESWSK